MRTIKLLHFFMPGLLVFSCGKKQQAGYETFHKANGWGYNIRVDGRILIHQESIPGQADTAGFKTKPQAEATAKLVLQKLSKGGMPSVTAEEVETIENSNANE